MGTPSTPLLASFSNIEEFAKEEGVLGIEEPQGPQLEADDVVGVIEMPFDIAALITKYEGWGLTEDESKRLAKLWVKPIQRILGKYKNADLYIAISVLITTMTEKYVEFRIYNRDSSRDAGTGQDQLSQKTSE